MKKLVVFGGLIKRIDAYKDKILVVTEKGLYIIKLNPFSIEFREEYANKAFFTKSGILTLSGDSFCGQPKLGSRKINTCARDIAVSGERDKFALDLMNEVVIYDAELNVIDRFFKPIRDHIGFDGDRLILSGSRIISGRKALIIEDNRVVTRDAAWEVNAYDAALLGNSLVYSIHRGEVFIRSENKGDKRVLRICDKPKVATVGDMIVAASRNLLVILGLNDELVIKCCEDKPSGLIELADKTLIGLCGYEIILYPRLEEEHRLHIPFEVLRGLRSSNNSHITYSIEADKVILYTKKHKLILSLTLPPRIEVEKNEQGERGSLVPAMETENRVHLGSVILNKKKVSISPSVDYSDSLEVYLAPYRLTRRTLKAPKPSMPEIPIPNVPPPNLRLQLALKLKKLLERVKDEKDQ